MVKHRPFLLLTFFVFMGVTCSLLNTTRAQTFDYNKAYQDYQYSFDIYNQANTNFEEAKDFYSKNKTLTIKEDTRRKLLLMLRSRDQLAEVYLTTLRVKISENKGLGEKDKNDVFGKIDKEVLWYKDHTSRYVDGDPAEDLFAKSSEAKERYEGTTLPIVYNSLFLISLGEEIEIRQSHEVQYKNLRAIIDSGVSNNKIDMNPFNRWFTDIDLTIQNLKQIEETSRVESQKIYTVQNYNKAMGNNAYDSAINILRTSTPLDNQLNKFLIEVLTSISNQLARINNQI